jgi:hypothetical protein
MLHVVRLIERRFPEKSGMIVRILVAFMIIALVLGIALLFLR